MGLEYIPQLRITQKKNTVDNISLFTSMIEFISSLPGELSPLIKNQGDNLEFILYGKTDLTIFMEMLVPYQEFFFLFLPNFKLKLGKKQKNTIFNFN